MTSTSSRRNQSRPGRRPDRPQRPRELRDAGISPAKALGQHFLSDAGVADRIVDAAGLSRDDVVIEVGPGLGVLTERLAAVARRVIAVEIDARLAQRLREALPATSNVMVVESDVLALQPEELLAAAGIAADTPYRVVANLPYNAGAAIVRHFLEAAKPPAALVVMLQREVAESVCAVPGGLGLLGVSVQVYAEARKLFDVPPTAFYPPPKVTSSVIRLDVRAEPLVPVTERDHFFVVVRAGFSAPRKQLRNTLAQGLKQEPAQVVEAIDAAGIEQRLRPQDLGVDDWLRLSREIGR